MAQPLIPRYKPGETCPIDGFYLILDNSGEIPDSVESKIFLEKEKKFPEFPQGVSKSASHYYYTYDPNQPEPGQPI